MLEIRPVAGCFSHCFLLGIWNSPSPAFFRRREKATSSPFLWDFGLRMPIYRHYTDSSLLRWDAPLTTANSFGETPVISSEACGSELPLTLSQFPSCLWPIERDPQVVGNFMQVLFEGWTLASDGFLGSTAVHRVASGVWEDLTRDSCSNVEGGEEDEANHNQLLRTAVTLWVP